MQEFYGDYHRLTGTIKVPGDKSISHRSIMFGSLAQGKTEITGFLMGADCLSTISCFRQLGIEIEVEEEKITVHGKGLDGLTEPSDILDVGNSGTTIRLISGILAGQTFMTTLTGDGSIRKRPMGRVIKPLKEMGAQIWGRSEDKLAPLAIRGTKLEPITYDSAVASAQVKSAILLAGLYADGWTEVREPHLSRNHTELMLTGFGAEIEQLPNGARIKGRPDLVGQKIQVPSDISSAAFFMVAALIVPNSKICLTDVGLNPTRTGIIDVLKDMGGKISIENIHNSGGELLGDIWVESSQLKGVTIGGEMIPRLVDEIPVLAVAAACAEGITEVHDAEELKVKESNRLEAIANELSKMGIDIEELEDGLRICGGNQIKGAKVESYHDHRIAMALAIASLVADGKTEIKDFDAVAISWPGFMEDLAQLGKDA